MAAHTYWRINFSANNGNNPAIASLAMHTSIGGSDVCTGGTAGGTSINGSFPASNAFDSNGSTDCQTTATPSTISYQFASAVGIVEYVVTSSASLASTYAPNSWTFEYSDNGSTWTVAAYAKGHVAWNTSEDRTLNVNVGAETGKSLKPCQPAKQVTVPAGTIVQNGKAPATNTTTVSGTVKVLGVATSGLIVRAYAKLTGELVGQATTDGSGNFAINCALWKDVYCVAFDPTTYQALVYDQVVPG